jgi:tetratricopeptide (TPR) repeat protein
MGREGRTSGSNPELRALLDEAGTSNTALARAVAAAGAEEDVHVGTNTTSVKRMLDGCQPRWPVPRLVAKVLSRHLHREISITECGFADRIPASDDRYDGLRWSGTLDGTVSTIVELSGRDMNRRTFLMGPTFSAAAFSEPALLALTVPPAESTARVAGRRIGMPEVEIINEQGANLRRLDCRYGSGRVREQCVQLLHSAADTVMHGTYSEKTGKALLSAVAQASWLAGNMAEDVGRHSLAQRYYIQALDLTMRAGDRIYAGYLLSQMARMTQRIGRSALTEHDRLRHARQSVTLARAGLGVTQGVATPLLSAQLHVAEGRGLALLGDRNVTRQAIREAERHYERSRPGEEPPSLTFYAGYSLAADIGRCLRNIGEPEQAVKMIGQAVDGVAPWQVRGRGFFQIDLATAHLASRDLEKAAVLGREAVRTAAEVSSTCTLDGLRALQRQIRPLRASSPHLGELDERITDLLTRNCVRQDGTSPPE